MEGLCAPPASRHRHYFHFLIFSRQIALARYSCAPASYRIGRDGTCTRLLLDGQEERDENV